MSKLNFNKNRIETNIMQENTSLKQDILSYDYRVCCSIDILGFKQHIKNLVDSNDLPNFKSINNLHNSLTKMKELGEDAKSVNLGFEFSQFSDCIVISFDFESGSNLIFILLSILHVQMELLQNGFLIRGGISIGRLHHSNEYVFGDAMVRAYELESKFAKYPRIILDKEVIEICKEFGDHQAEQEEKYLKELIFVDYDGQNYLNYFEATLTEFDEPSDVFTYIDNIRNNFLKDFESFAIFSPIFDKLNWLNKKVVSFEKKLSNS